MKHVLVPLAEGCEELEAVTIIDLLRRAEVDVVVAGLKEGPVTASRKVKIVPDMSLDEALTRSYDMIVLPGGLPGADNLNNDERIQRALREMNQRGAYVAAICAAPAILAKAGLLKGKKATSYPGFVDKMNLPDVTYTGAAVECDGNIITSKGPGTAMDFALTLIEVLRGKEIRKKVEEGLVRS